MQPSEETSDGTSTWQHGIVSSRAPSARSMSAIQAYGTCGFPESGHSHSLYPWVPLPHPRARNIDRPLLPLDRHGSQSATWRPFRCSPLHGGKVPQDHMKGINKLSIPITIGMSHFKTLQQLPTLKVDSQCQRGWRLWGCD